ncbi:MULTISPECIES: hypothetical protein [Parachlamydia]|jgi:hypothetical protein|uniref:Uncharacterized protein n=2 Tax=Parachlamydia acanthamoebae TaxID=83552 RepID=F8KW04_PARAV|nr:hypothetical protein [Parachlamydia acanthamoebae]EFB41215.1 hypothetical protein pah_c048o035 [Parachlamydia acanthamoebae str. Hall's coccus]KIA76470.1 hypothetical protein DB43_AG00480 [Parachlamydia acanthamoebae]CCB85091.1 putative uncharacterized protein [Parachlamydia acanthamoebae UV-7]
MRINLNSFARIFNHPPQTPAVQKTKHKGRTWKTTNETIESALNFFHSSRGEKKAKRNPIASERVTIRMAQPNVSELKKPKK